MEQSSVNGWASRAGLEPECVELDSDGASRVHLGLSMKNGRYAQGLVKVASAKRGGAILASAELYRWSPPYKIAHDGYREYESVEDAVSDMAVRFRHMCALVDEQGEGAKGTRSRGEKEQSVQSAEWVG